MTDEYLSNIEEILDDARRGKTGVAIEIARRFGSEDSGAFVNGVLDRVADVLGVKGKGDEQPDENPDDA